MNTLLPSKPIEDSIPIVCGHQKKTGCRSCGEACPDKRLKPFCSIVCRTLGQAGFGWRLNPYRIVDLESGMVLTSGPRFDLTPRGLGYLQELAERLRQPAALHNSLAQAKEPAHELPSMGAYIGGMP